ncbi:2-dehydropantoate 2-reductase [Anaerobacillus sp. MEB173]|uniref:2-dehydropantoate 2-reductase n=1 Tax=Anaerobacillus sp. MEB173 TaxID=3383345 RepID=UPI003F91ED45
MNENMLQFNYNYELEEGWSGQVRIGIVGGGAIGLLLASYLCEAKFEVVILTNRQKQAETINNEGITCIRLDKQKNYAVKAEVFEHCLLDELDLLFIAVKQYQVRDVIKSLLQRKSRCESLVFLQNGMGHLEYLKSLPDMPIYIGIVEHGGLKLSDSIVEHTGLGCLKIGTYTHEKELQEVWGRLSAAGFTTKEFPNWLEIMQRKLVVNAVINPLTALYGVENGKLLENSFFKKNMEALFNEAVSVVKIEDREQLWNELLEICRNTGRNRSSMLRDLDCNRQTEIDAISGYLLGRAKKESLIIPYTEFVLNSIKGIEQYEIGGAGRGYVR